MFLLGILIVVSTMNQSCIDGRTDTAFNNTICHFNDWQSRDTECDNKEMFDDRYSYVKINFLGMKTGRCYCCAKDQDKCYPTDNPWPLGFGVTIGITLVVVISIWCGMRVQKWTPMESFATTTTATTNIDFDGHLFDSEGQRTSIDDITEDVDYHLLLTELMKFNNVPRRSFSYDRLGGKLGEGQFGVVYRGSLQHKGELQSVAIKTIRPYSSSETMKTFLNEIKVMQFVGEHPNVITLLGACVEEVQKGNIFGILELCEKGDLKNYLRMSKISPAIKTTVEISCILQGYLALPEIPVEHGSYSKLWSDLDVGGNNLFPQFVKWAIEIAAGMAYLGSKKVLHVDLAARNVLLTNDLIAKVGDFGLSRKLYYVQDVYDKTGKEPIPLKWVALESVTENKYSVKSDVWSYGITLWEIFSFGKEPFPNLSPSEFISVLISGIRLPCPEYCSEEIFEQISNCWIDDPDDRPGFEELEQYFRNQLLTLGTKYYKTDSAIISCQNYYAVSALNPVFLKQTLFDINTSYTEEIIL